jgi:hypothetical protein
MKCDHCGSLMVLENVCNRSGESESWRCILCGEYVDPVILENRNYQRAIQENDRGNKGEEIEEPHEEQALSSEDQNGTDSLSVDEGQMSSLEILLLGLFVPSDGRNGG